VRLAPLIIAAALLVVAVTGVAVAPAQPSARDRSPHLLRVPDTAAGAAALARTDARTVARYESFSLVEAQGDDEALLRRTGADRRDDMRTVTTAAGAIDPATDRVPLAAKDAPDRERVLALVQFVGPPKDAWLERLRATGARLVSVQAANAYGVYARGAAVDRLAALQGTDPAVRAVSVLTAADKLFDRSSPSGAYEVTTIAGAPGTRARSGAVGAPITIGALRTDSLRLSAAEAARRAADPAVVAVLAHVAPELDDERAAQIVAGNLTAPALTQPAASPPYRDWLTDKGIRADMFDFAIDITDSGLDDGADPPAHADFYESGSKAQSDRIAYLANYSADTNARDCLGHGTHVASIAAGASGRTGAPEFEDGQGFDHGTGVAPFARIGMSKIADCTGAFASLDVRAIAAAAYAAGARVSNNSWGAQTRGLYTSRAAQFDALVRDASPEPGHQPLVEVFSAGNDAADGYPSIGSNAVSKNGIAVGAAESVRATGTDGCGITNADADSARDVGSFSSRGTIDGRRKPDLVAPGTHVAGAAPQHAGYTGAGVCTKFLAGTSWYSVVGGTSQAAPHVAGAAAVVRAWYQRSYGAPPSPALTKALLVNTATDLAGGQNGQGGTIAAGPNEDQGWGRVNLGTVLDGTRRDFRDQVTADTLQASGDQRIRSYAVVDTTKPVKVTLAFTDAPGTLPATPVVNDLDLVITSGGRTYKGNVFDGALSTTGGAADPRNNVESVYLPAGTSGRFAVKVVGASIPGDGVPGNANATDQDYALVVSNADPSPAAIVVHDSATLDASVAAGGDGDGMVEPGEPFAIDERLANAGDITAAGVSGTIAAAGATMTQTTSLWPAIAPGSTATNATRFTGTLASDVTCGADVAATLALTTADGPQTVPLTLATGGAGALLSRTRTHSPALAIPDNDPAGVAATLDVTTAGRIKDVNVRIGRLEHAAVGDLQIEIVAPDGTAVTLVDRPGGPDNDADNLLETVFDDEGPVRPQNDQLARFDGKEQQGTWTLRVRDLAPGDSGTLVEWGVDAAGADCSVAAVTKLTAGPAEGSTVTSRSPSFDFSSDLPNATYQCRLNTETFRACTSPKKYAGLPDATYAFEVRAIVGGATDPTPARRTWTIDTTAPETTITDGPSGRMGSAAATLRFAASDGTFECSLDGDASTACTSPQAYDALAEGPHTFQVRARDAVGNVETTPATWTWTVDTTAPTPTITAPVDGRTITGTAGTAPGDAGAVTVVVYDAGTPVRTLATTPDAAGAWSVAVAPALPPGRYTARATQADEAAPANVGHSDDSSFEVAPTPIVIKHPMPPPPPPRSSPPAKPAAVAPSFVVAPAELRRGDVLVVLAACASACTATADLAGHGSARASLPGPGSTVLRVRVKRHEGRATLRVDLTEGARTLALERRVAIRRQAGLRRIAAKGLRLWSACTGACALRATLSVAGKPIAAAQSPTALTLRAGGKAKAKLKKARRLRALLDVVTVTEPSRAAQLKLALRR
jgi:subtilisin-like proprotein convertase family protein